MVEIVVVILVVLMIVLICDELYLSHRTSRQDDNAVRSQTFTFTNKKQDNKPFKCITSQNN